MIFRIRAFAGISRCLYNMWDDTLDPLCRILASYVQRGDNGCWRLTSFGMPTIRWRKSLARILDSINDPAQLRKLTIAQMQQLAEEIRRELIEKVSVTCG